MEIKPVRDLIDRLNSEKIEYCHWKSNQHIWNVFNGPDDIDMLVAQCDILKLNIILNQLNFKRFRLPEKRSYLGVEDYLALDCTTGVFVHLHLHYQLTLGEKFLKGYQLPFSVSVINRRIFDEKHGIFISSHEDEMWLFIFRNAVKVRARDILRRKKFIGESYTSEFLWLKENFDMETFKRVVVSLFDTEICMQMINIIEKGLSLGRLLQLKNNIRRKYGFYNAYSRLSASLTALGREFFRIIEFIHNRIGLGKKSYRRTPVSGGKIIALIGLDGSGKSTVSKEVARRLGRVIDVKPVYLGSGDGKSSLARLPLRVLYKLLKNSGKVNTKNKLRDEKGNITRNGEKGFVKLLRPSVSVLWTVLLNRERNKKLRLAAKLRTRGYTIITDRYPQSQFLDFIDGPRYYLHDGKNISKSMVKSEKKIFDMAKKLAPDTAVFLIASPETAYIRKPDEVDIENYREMLQNLKKLNFGENTRHIYVDADKPLADVVASALAAIWENF